MDVRNRLLDFISLKKISISDFERISGLSNGYVHKIKNSVGKRGLLDIQRAFPELNTSWLLTGEGAMLKTNGSAIANGDGSVAVSGNNNRNVVGGSETALLQERIHHLEELVAEKERLIKILMEGRK